MQISLFIQALARQALEQERPSMDAERYRVSLGDTDMFIAEKGDEGISIVDILTHEGVEYQIGTIKNTHNNSSA